ncbi:unnamed protein product [Linum trigynum]|uniref:Uncharacterized protein n=1 Tax=Linum trigynum TaxID=586398 RepID=A0AAV2FMS4_9ROSI
MASSYCHHAARNSSSHRGLAMVLALTTAVVLSPLYASGKNDHSSSRFYPHYEPGWSSGLVLPVVLAGLIIAIKTTSSSSSTANGGGSSFGSSLVLSPDPSWVLRIGSSSWGLAGILVMLMLVLSWQESAQHFFWR